MSGEYMNMMTAIQLAYWLTVLVMAFFLVLENRNPIKTISWILVLIALPGLGIVIYWFFGQIYRRKNRFSRRGLNELERLRKLTRQQLDRLPENRTLPAAAKSKKHLINLLLSNADAILSDDNDVQILRNGEQAFPAMFKAIEQARRHVHIEFYIIENDTLGMQLHDVLIAKVREGVEVRLIYDDVGSWKLPGSYINSLRRAGVHIDCFIKVRFPLLSSKVNYRNHRKLVVVDGNIGFIGGLNIADRYLQGSPKIGTWRDTHLMLTGGAAVALQVIFMADWYFVSKEILAESYFRPIRHGHGKTVQIVGSGPDSDWGSISQAYFVAIASATEQVFISTPYLIPNAEIASAMKAAALGGIDVRILMPQKSDAGVTGWSSQSYISELLEAGVRIFFYQPGFVHSKFIVVDGVFASIGTANIDFRSLETNFEVNAMIYDEATAIELREHFLADLKCSREILLPDWEKRPRWSKVLESFARILSPLL
ncbi:MAG: cardiolipin synthase [Bacteroidales bacterium]|jgi:cardiolipin synthase|nr:cardiolipin synthase [Bacteroidales bacterium]